MNKLNLCTINQPIPNEDLWGSDQPDSDEIECPLLIDGKCPLNCNRCKEFENENYPQITQMGADNLATESTGDTEK